MSEVRGVRSNVVLTSMTRRNVVLASEMRRNVSVTRAGVRSVNFCHSLSSVSALCAMPLLATL